jgi:putative nucleotidyltransferase with HDIG domain
LVYSSFNGFPRKVISITRGFVILGLNKVRNLAISATVIGAFRDKQMDFTAFWKHSLATAVAADVIAKNLSIHEVDDAFTAGLLHDLGKLVIAVCFPDDLERINILVQEKNCWIGEAETEVFELDHARMGFWLATKWSLPPEIVNSVRFHHKPFNARENLALVHVVHLADIVARALQVGHGGDQVIPAIEKEIWDNFSLDEAKLDFFFEQTLQGLEKADAFFEMIEGR